MRINYEVELLTPAITAEMGTIGKDIDIVAKVDNNGNPFFPASHIKGVLRNRYEEFEKALWGERSETSKKVFGTEGNSPAKIRVSDLKINSNSSVSDMDYRYGIRMDRKTRTTAHNSLFSYEFIKDSRKFLGSIEIDESGLTQDEIKLLKGSLLNLNKVGGLKSRGLGDIRVNILSEEASKKDLTEVKDKKISSVEKYRYTLEVMENLILKSSENGNIISVRDSLQGSTVRGAIIEVLLKAGANLHDLLEISVGEPERESEKQIFASTFKSKYPIDDKSKYVDKLFYEEDKVYLSSDKSCGVKLERASAKGFNDIINDVGIEIDRKTKAAREGQLFNSEIIKIGEKDSKLTGEILISKEMAEFLNGKFILLGKKKLKGFGKTKITFEKYRDERKPLKDRISEKSFRDKKLVTVSALSDIVLPFSELYDINSQLLAMMGVPFDGPLLGKSDKTFVNIENLGGYNIVNKMRKGDELVIKKGSVISYIGDGMEILSHLERVERDGVGLRKTEGFGKVEICSPKHLIWGGK